MRFFRLIFDFIAICGLSNVALLYFNHIPLFFSLPITIFLCIANLVVNIIPGSYKTRSKRCRVLGGGIDLLIVFMYSTIADIVIAVNMLLFGGYEFWQYAVHGIIAFLVCGTAFWNGIIRCYTTSAQLGIKLRVLGAVFGMVPIVNIVFLVIIISTARKEVIYEMKHDAIEESRKGQNICATKYPVLLVHGVFFRDRKSFNYWGRIPSALTLNGATIFYGNQQSALSVKDSAMELSERIKEIIRETGAEKVNIIAHSKGGLDARYAISRLGCDKYTATLTTINTPHHGCIFVDNIFKQINDDARNTMASAYNTMAKTTGDTNPDFLSAVSDLRHSVCEEFNKNVPDCDGVIYRSVGSSASKTSQTRFPMSVFFPFVSRTEGENDGLVSVEAMKWGESFKLIRVKGERGVSHADVIDLNKDNIDGFDVREFYVRLVAELKKEGF